MLIRAVGTSSTYRDANGKPALKQAELTDGAQGAGMGLPAADNTPGELARGRDRVVFLNIPLLVKPWTK